MKFEGMNSKPIKATSQKAILVEYSASRALGEERIVIGKSIT
jgi:hypothetical protein